MCTCKSFEDLLFICFLFAFYHGKVHFLSSSHVIHNSHISTGHGSKPGHAAPAPEVARRERQAKEPPPGVSRVQPLDRTNGIQRHRHQQDSTSAWHLGHRHNHQDASSGPCVHVKCWIEGAAQRHLCRCLTKSWEEMLYKCWRNN